MERSRNRQPRQQTHSDIRGRASHGRGQGRGSGPSSRASYPSNVPTIAQVLPNTPVSIVLKIDQPTGREVQGLVADVLTSGNHPRGIKVRLRDGRVGRVQRLVSLEDAELGEGGASGLGRNGEVSGGEVLNGYRASGGRFAARDVRGEDAMNVPPKESYSLDDFVKVKKSTKQSSASENTTAENTRNLKTAVQVCPVCGEFEGDEMAVAHHVAEHFD